jgi:YbgC/YbaW family acyl-CoA thioester hydrolase
MSEVESGYPEESTRDEVMFYDTDVGGVVHNLAYLRMIERCRTKLGEQLGFDLRSMAETQVYPVVVRTEIDYRGPGRLGDVLETRGVLEEWGRVRFWCAFEMRRPADGALLITCRQQLALVQMPEGRPLRLKRSAGGNRPPSCEP